ncbi:MAG TPA: hypothetical protein VGO43_00695 [Pyrinomonadaceae bacterium]|jgi:hypothetical protein|nr:hypothetical protein [Pyrinomonadaceae bacterium]
MKISLLLLIAFISISAVCAAGQATADAAKVKKAVGKIGVHGDITVVRSDGQWFYGNVEQVDDGSFTIYEIEQKARINFSYAQVSKVFKGYGTGGSIHRDINGHRIPPSRRHIGWIVVGGLAAVLIAVTVSIGKD